MSNYGFVKTAVAVPVLRVANPDYNAVEMTRLALEAAGRDASLIVFPELSITGYTCGDLFLQKFLLRKAWAALETLLEQTRDVPIVSLVGAPVSVKDRLYNCAVAISCGQILGVVPKMYVPNSKEYYEKRWFASGFELSRETDEIDINDKKIPFGILVFKCRDPEFSFGIEICEDLWAPIPPSSYLALNGAGIIANLSASNELVAKAEYRRQLVSQQSARTISAYLYAAAGVHESTTDVVFGGDCLICENGAILESSARFRRDSGVYYADIDVGSLEFDRRQNKSFADGAHFQAGLHQKPRVVEFTLNKQYRPESKNFDRRVAKNPFVPSNPQTVEERCSEIFNIQVTGLARRLEHTGSRQAVIGVSGGLDSTLALLVARKTMDVLKRPSRDVLAVTMPGFGTTDDTYHNAVALMKALDVSCKEIDIKKACLQHFEDIEHDPEVYDVTYENVQARERMQVLMDLANKVGGLVVGTGDLSELALGWCTYNGDHMAMYSVNSGIPKTLVKFLVQWVADHIMTGEARKTLYKIINTPISPELLPPDAQGQIRQKTEQIIGPYELHDFFLFYTLRYGMEPRKILFLAQKAYQDMYTREETLKWLKLFYKRFFQSQFKRSCLPDGPKVGSVSLSPRGDWRMPSDADVSIWLRELEN